MHYETAAGGNYGVPNIFSLGTPVPYGSAVDPPTRRGAGGRGGLRTHGGGAAESGVGGTEPPPAVTRVTGVYPNPFAGTVTTAFDLATEGPVQLAVYDARGMLVRTLAAGTRAPGRYRATWDGRSEAGRHMPSGLYFVRFEAGEARQTHKVVMMD
jgi:hypothetical protein